MFIPGSPRKTQLLFFLYIFFRTNQAVMKYTLRSQEYFQQVTDSFIKISLILLNLQFLENVYHK